jgi:gamma-glutamyltranspeptidase / glutathione hydrolase
VRTVFVIVLLTLAGQLLLSDRLEARVAKQLGDYAVVTANPAATAAAEKILNMGGSAVDAAIAAQLVLGVVEPQSSGIGGGAVVLYRESADGPIRAFDGLARSPAAYDPQVNSAPGFRHGGVTVGVPGSVYLMHHLHSRYGKLSWSALRAARIQDHQV